MSSDSSPRRSSPLSRSTPRRPSLTATTTHPLAEVAQRNYEVAIIEADAMRALAALAAPVASAEGAATTSSPASTSASPTGRKANRAASAVA